MRTALSLVDCEEEYLPAVQYVFGSYLVSNTLQEAKTVSPFLYDPSKYCMCCGETVFFYLPHESAVYQNKTDKKIELAIT